MAIKGASNVGNDSPLFSTLNAIFSIWHIASILGCIYEDVHNKVFEKTHLCVLHVVLVKKVDKTVLFFFKVCILYLFVLELQI